MHENVFDKSFFRNALPVRISLGAILYCIITFYSFDYTYFISLFKLDLFGHVAVIKGVNADYNCVSVKLLHRLRRLRFQLINLQGWCSIF